MRVMTWNLWWRFGPQWRERQPGIAATLRDVAPDIVALQEVWAADGTSQAHEFAAQLGLHAAFVRTTLPPAPIPPETADQAGVEVGIGLLSRWPISRWWAVPLPAVHRPTPVSLVAELAHPDGPLHVIATCIEWEPEFEDDRLSQGRAVAELLGSPDFDGSLPVVLAGDLNAIIEGPQLEPLLAMAIDAWSAGGGDPDAVTLSSQHPFAPVEAKELIDQRIDHIFVRPGHPGQQLAFQRAELAGHPVDGLDPSDHLAVVCDFAW